jgi:C-terminal binding protein
MSRPRVVLTDFIADDLAPERAVLGEVADIVALNAMTEAELLPAVETADAVIQYHLVTMSAATLDRMARCKLLIRGGVGYDNVDAIHARKRGIPLANVPDYGTEEVADAAIGHTLALTRGINLANSRLRRGVGPWTHRLVAPLQRLRGRVFGVVGLGRIGTATALRAKALGMDIVFYDPYAPDGVDKALGVRRVERLEELCEQAFVISPIAR